MYLNLLTDSNVYRYEQYIPEAFLHKNELLGTVCLDDEDETLMGVAVAEPSDTVLNILWLYVLPEYRRLGAGSLMLQGLVEMAEAAHLSAVDVYYHSDADEGPAEADEPDVPGKTDETEHDAPDDPGETDLFLLENGYVVMRENPIMTFTLEGIISSDYVASHNKNKDRKELKPYECISLEDISPEDEQLVISNLKSQGYPDYTYVCRRDISFICKKEGTVLGCMLVTDDSAEQTLTIMLLISFMQDPLCAAKLIIVAGDSVLKLFPPEYRVSFVVANESSLRLVGTILDDTDIVRTTGYTTHAVFEVNS